MKERAFIFGAGSTGENILLAAGDMYDVIGFIDNNPKRWSAYGGGGITLLSAGRNKRA